jgi:hypothetical protein
MILRLKPHLIFAMIMTLHGPFVSSCSEQAGKAPISTLDVTDVDHTVAKRQSIGNCWLYATSTWAESLHLTAIGEEIDISESYWTYWHWYDLLFYAGSKIETGGNWSTASWIIAKHGWMLEEEFIPSEKDQEMSLVQADAERYVNSQLAPGGLLAIRENRTPDSIRSVLDKAFNVSMSTAEGIARPANQLIVGYSSRDKATLTLDQVIEGSTSTSRWVQTYYPVTYSNGLTQYNRALRKKTLKRVLTALNDGHPVIMSVEVEFNALRTTPYATFDLETLTESGRMGRQGGHLLVLEDYTVDNVPGIGTLGEGEMSDDLKQAALLGDVTTIKAKNSWGTNRPERGLADGHTAFTIGYLNSPIPWHKAEQYEGQPATQSNANWRSPLSQFILPPGY